MRSMLVIVAGICVVAMVLCAGCESVAMKWEPIKRIVFMPKVFEDGRIKTNPWREVPHGPEYPYELVYHESTNTFRVVARSKAPDISFTKIKTWSRDAEPFTIVMPVPSPDRPEMK